MLMVSDYIVLLWIVPALVHLIIPLTIFASVTLYNGANSLAVTLRRAYAKTEGRQTVVVGDARRSGRISIPGLRAEISDTMTSCTGLVANISKIGLCLKDVPEKLSTSRSLLSVNIHDRSADYRIVARPRWEQFQTVKGKTIGLEIARAPANWDEFLLSH